MSALGHLRPIGVVDGKSALPPKAGIRADSLNVRFVPLTTKVRRNKKLGYSGTAVPPVTMTSTLMWCCALLNQFDIVELEAAAPEPLVTAVEAHERKGPLALRRDPVCFEPLGRPRAEIDVDAAIHVLLH